MDERRLTYNEWLTALCVWREARGTPREARQAVAAVIRNRVADDRWPSQAGRVVLQPRQFSCFNADDPNAVKWPGASDKIWQECVEDVLANGQDPTGGATHYYSVNINPPYWAKAEKLTATIGPFRFYKL